MGFRSLVSFGFLILPIAVTLGVLLGLQAFREARGMPPPFVSHDIEMETYCQRAYGISPPTHGLQYTCEYHQNICSDLATFGRFPFESSSPRVLDANPGPLGARWAD